MKRIWVFEKLKTYNIEANKWENIGIYIYESIELIIY